LNRVSVIIPTYQSAQFIRETIDSVLAQTYKDYEVIVVDGKSTDGTVEILKSYSNRIRIVIQDGKGIANARNVGILMSEGEYVAFVDSDDVWLPDKLSIQVKFLDEKSSRVGLVYSDAWLFPEDDVGKTSYLANKRAFQIGKPRKGKITRQLFAENFIPASTVMIRKFCFEEVGLFDESFMLCEDIDMWIRIAKSFEIDYQDLVLAKIRLHLGSATQNREQLLKSQIMLENKIMTMMPYLLEKSNLKSAQRRQCRNHLLLGIEYLMKGKNDDAKQEFRYCTKLCPRSMNAYFLLVIALFPFNLSKRFVSGRYLHGNFAQRVYENLSR
jgi:glycosyltransferase involved in cell wall biosynthesis